MSCQNHSHEHACGCHHENNNKLLLIRLVIGAAVFIGAVIFKLPVLYILAYLVLGYDILLAAVSDLKHIFNENLLMSIASLGALAIGEYPEAASVMLFYQIGELLSDYAVGKSKKSIKSLMDLRADTATVLRNGEFIKADCEDISIGERILVSAGEKIPLDGIILKGCAYLDTSAITGEAMPRYVEEGDRVLSGMINTDSVIEIKAEKEFADSTASKILELIESKKASKSEKFITKFARSYTPIVVILAIAIAVFPPLFSGDWHRWIYTALTFLMVSCPCALVVSLPLTFFAGIGGASKKGILLKGSYALENLSKIKTVAFDKTGTLTKGNFSVESIRTKNGSKAEILEYAAYAEYYSLHSVAKAIKTAYDKKISTERISDYKEAIGKGVSAKIDAHTVLVGSPEFCGAEERIKNSVCVNIDGKFCGYIIIGDSTKSASKEAIETLKSLGINSVMLTGDLKENAEEIAQKLGIPYFCELLPQDKIEKIKSLGKNVAFVGDGINDAPVISCADVGISMGGIGSDAAIEASDAVIMTDDPKKVFEAIKFARKTMKIVRQNIVFAIAIKLAIMILGLLGFASMWMAVLVDVGVCLLAVLNAIRAYKD